MQNICLQQGGMTHFLQFDDCWILKRDKCITYETKGTTVGTKWNNNGGKSKIVKTEKEGRDNVLNQKERKVVFLLKLKLG